MICGYGFGYWGQTTSGVYSDGRVNGQLSQRGVLRGKKYVQCLVMANVIASDRLTIP